MDIRKVFGANVRHYRLAAGMSQEAVAVKIGADRAYISQIERGGQNVTLLSLHHVADALGVKWVELLADPPAGAGDA